MTFETRGMFRKRFEGGFRRGGFRAGFQDRWHFPKDGPEGVSTEASKGAFDRAFGKAPKGLIGRASGARVIYRKAPKGGGLSGWHVPKVLSKEVSKGGLPE